MKSPFLITLYYALASIIGLILSVIGAVTLLNLILTTYILHIPRYPSMPPEPSLTSSSLVKRLGDSEEQELTADDKEALLLWRESYSRWQKEQGEYDQEGVERKRTLATAISLLAVGIPTLFFHQKELRKK